ncbi:hypothetical protein AVEN_153001-1 [Araneus ventricosus]|uniref:Endonuclease/exonuclease/phosphatase domain-containing protein n=1 Tax=Araneus ventricosus TaxID=182803 RepID=A0A4Y2AD65_ARAVE|nr:hypothetical protein AVEN_153001-1 [Araneus ventricosus]
MEIDITPGNADPESIFASTAPNMLLDANRKTNHRAVELRYPYYIKELAAYKKIKALLVDGHITLNSSLFTRQNFNVLQINFGREKAAANHLHPTVVKLKMDILLVQEQYINNNQIHSMPMFQTTYQRSHKKNKNLQ